MTMADPLRIGISRYLSRRLLPLSVGIGLFIAAGPPVIYWVIEHANLRHYTTHDAESLAKKLQGFALEAPTLWKYQTYKIINIAEEFHPAIDVSGFCVLDEKGEPITGYEYGEGKVRHGEKLAFTDELRITMGSAPIVFNNRKVGTVLVTASDRALISSTALLFMISTMIGTLLAFLAFRFPLGVVRRAEAEIGSLIATVKESEEKYRSLVENVPDIIWTVDSEGNTHYISDNLEQIYGYTPAEIYASGNALWFDRIHPEDVQRVKEAFASLFSDGTAFDVEFRIRRKDGEWIWFHDRATKTYERDGVRYVDGIGSDVSGKKLTEEALLESEDKFRSLAEKSLVGVYLIQDNLFRYLNPKMSEIFGYPLEDMVGRMGPKDLTLAEDCHVVRENLSRRLSGEIDSIQYEFRGVTKGQDIIHLEVFGCRTIFNGKPAVVGTLLDITDRKRAEMALTEQARKLEQLALFDELTGAYNRRGFLLQAGQQLKTAERMGRVALLIFADLDGLKEINDRLGHHEGDVALKETADLLRESFRGSDIIGRMGGDEFAVFAMCGDLEGEEIIVSRIEQNISRKNAGEERRYSLSVSIGVVHHDSSSPCSLDELIERADAMMYARKVVKKGNGNGRPFTGVSSVGR